MTTRKNWTQGEVDFLFNNPRLTAADAAAVLGRSRRGVLRKKARLREGPKAHRPCGARPGEAHPKAKLTDDLVREMRRLYATGVSHHKLAIQFDVAFSTEWKAVTRRTWKHVT